MSDRLLTIYVAVLAGLPAILTVFISILLLFRQSKTKEKIVEIHEMVNGRLTELIESLKQNAEAEQELHGIQERAAGVIEGKKIEHKKN